jgi:hypothetical protein
MLKSEVATGRRMNGAEMCILYPEYSISLPIIRSYSKVLEGSKARFGFKNYKAILLQTLLYFESTITYSFWVKWVLNLKGNR